MLVLVRTDRLLVRQMKSPDMSEGGIILPTQSKVKEAWGTILQMGPDVDKPDANGVGGIKEHDRIAFADFSGVEVELDTDEGKEEFLILSQDDVLLVLREEAQGLNEQELDDGNDDSDERSEGHEQGSPADSEVHCPVESGGGNL